MARMLKCWYEDSIPSSSQDLELDGMTVGSSTVKTRLITGQAHSTLNTQDIDGDSLANNKWVVTILTGSSCRILDHVLRTDGE